VFRLLSLLPFARLTAAHGPDSIGKHDTDVAAQPDVQGTDPAPGRTPLDTTSPGKKASVQMNSQPTGVDTSSSSASSQQDR
jgi:hypothetical protein